jgi:hypothetical protein
MKRRVEDSNNESNKKHRKYIIDIYNFNSLSQDNYNMIFQQTKDYRDLLLLLKILKTSNKFTKQFLDNNYNNEIKCL